MNVLFKNHFVWLVLLVGVVGGIGFLLSQPSNDPQIMFIGWDEAGVTQLFLTDQAGITPQQLTNSTTGINEFAISPDGKKVIYLLKLEGGTELWLMRLNRFLSTSPQLILTCSDVICSQPVWAADGRRLIYEKRLLLNEDGDRGSPSLYWLDTETGASISVEETQDSPSYGAQFSPDGSWISYVSPADEGVVAYHFDNGRYLTIPSLVGSPAAWHPDNNQVIVADLNNSIQHGEEGDDHQSHSHNVSPAINLFITDLNTGMRTLLTDAPNVDDGTAVISPTGEWIAFGRKLNQTATGRQIWLIRPDGSDAHALTDELLINFGGLRWSGNGRYLLYQRFDTQQPETHPSIHIININSGEIINISPAGFQPSWVPSS